MHVPWASMQSVSEEFFELEIKYIRTRKKERRREKSPGSNKYLRVKLCLRLN